MEKLAEKNPKEATEKFFESLEKNAEEWRDNCYKKSNSTAKANNRTNTVARLIVIPFNDPSLYIDKDGEATPAKFACYERATDGDINKPLFDHTVALLEEERWDKKSVLQAIEERQNEEKKSDSLSNSS